MQGIDAQNEGRLEEAKKLYNLVLLSEPHNSDAHHNLGIISLIYSKLETGRHTNEGEILELMEKSLS